jgi:hypothetical protein
MIGSSVSMRRSRPDRLAASLLARGGHRQDASGISGAMASSPANVAGSLCCADALGGASRPGCRRTALGMSALGARPTRFRTCYRLCCSMRPRPAARSLRAVQRQPGSVSDSAARRVDLDLCAGVRETNDPATLRASDRRQAEPIARAIFRSVRLSIGPLRRSEVLINPLVTDEHPARWDAII